MSLPPGPEQSSLIITLCRVWAQPKEPASSNCDCRPQPGLFHHLGGPGYQFNVEHVELLRVQMELDIRQPQVASAASFTKTQRR